MAGILLLIRTLLGFVDDDGATAFIDDDGATQFIDDDGATG